MKQHTVPQSYLSRWCDPSAPAGQEPYIWIFGKDERQGKRRAPRKVFRKAHFYTDKRNRPGNPLWLEQGLGRIEGELARLMEKIINRGDELTLNHKVTLAAFAATMFVRTPSYEAHIRSQWEPVLRMGEEMAARVKKMTPEQIRELPQPIRSDGRSMSMEQVGEIVRHPLQVSFRPLIAGMMKVLMRMNCGLMYSLRLPGFITSDAPCVIFDPESWRFPIMYRGGLASRTVEVTLPLSSRFLALFGWKMIEDLVYCEMPEDIVDEMNRRTRFHCDARFVVCQNVTRDHWFDPGQPPPSAETNR